MEGGLKLKMKRGDAGSGGGALKVSFKRGETRDDPDEIPSESEDDDLLDDDEDDAPILTGSRSRAKPSGANRKNHVARRSASRMVPRSARASRAKPATWTTRTTRSTRTARAVTTMR